MQKWMWQPDFKKTRTLSITFIDIDLLKASQDEKSNHPNQSVASLKNVIGFFCQVRTVRRFSLFLFSSSAVKGVIQI